MGKRTLGALLRFTFLRIPRYFFPSYQGSLSQTSATLSDKTREPHRERYVNCNVTLASHQSALVVPCIPPISAQRENKLWPLALWGSLDKTISRLDHKLSLQEQEGREGTKGGNVSVSHLGSPYREQPSDIWPLKILSDSYHSQSSTSHATRICLKVFLKSIQIQWEACIWACWWTFAHERNTEKLTFYTRKRGKNNV